MNQMTIREHEWYMLKTINHKTCEVAKKIFRDCESVTYGQAVDGNRIGAIFALKSKFGYSDQKPQEIIVSAGTKADPQEIKNRYADMLECKNKLTDNLTTQETIKKAHEMPEKV